MEKCDFINTEINHDLGKGSGGPISIQGHHKTKKFINASRKLTGTCSNTDIKVDNWSTWFRNDPQSFQSVLKYQETTTLGGFKGVHPSQLYNLNTDGSPEMPYQSGKQGYGLLGHPDGSFKAEIEGSSHGVTDQVDISVRRFVQNSLPYELPTTDTNPEPAHNDFSDKNIFHIFDDCIPREGTHEPELEIGQGIVDIFFIIDTGDKLGKVLAEGEHTPSIPLKFNKYNINVIHSPITMGDSASKTKPHGPIYDKLYKKKKINNPCTLFSWLCTSNITIDTPTQGGDIPKEDFMTEFRIEANYLSASPYTYQNWKLTEGGNYVTKYNTTNPHKENNKPTVQKWLRANAELDKIKENNDSDPIPDENKMKEISLNVQKKRSGDHLQILFAKYIENFIHPVPNRVAVMRPSVYQTEPKLKELYQNDDVTTGTLAWNFINQTDYKSNTFFITGDWPACAFAIYNKVNTIMFYKTSDKNKTCFLIFTFNHE